MQSIELSPSFTDSQNLLPSGQLNFSNNTSPPPQRSTTLPEPQITRTQNLSQPQDQIDPFARGEMSISRRRNESMGRWGYVVIIVMLIAIFFCILFVVPVVVFRQKVRKARKGAESMYMYKDWVCTNVRTKDDTIKPSFFEDDEDGPSGDIEDKGELVPPCTYIDGDGKNGPIVDTGESAKYINNWVKDRFITAYNCNAHSRGDPVKHLTPYVDNAQIDCS